MADLTGMTLGPYRIIEQIGRGGMASVYKAYHAAMDRNVAVKVLPEEFASDPGFRERFEREAKVVANLQHTNILPVFDYGQDRNISYLVMPYIPTGTLKTYLKEKGALPFDETARIITQLAEALDYAHKQGVLHRDIKPDNVLFDESNNTLLSDFGLTRMVEGGSSLTGTGVIGTPAYMSPEQGQGLSLDHRSDIYSLGIILYEMVTGEVPFSADTPIAVIFKHVSEALPMPRSQRPDLPEAAENAILKALAKEPDQRWSTCSEMAQAFSQAIADITKLAQHHDAQPAAASVPAAPTQAAAEGATKPLQPEKSGLPKWVFGVAGLIAVALIAVLIVVVLPSDEGEPEPTSAVALSLTPISAENVNQLSELRRIGRGRLEAITLSPDETILAAVSTMGITFYDAQTLEEQRFLEHQGAAVMAWSPNGTWMASGASYPKPTIRVWDPSSGELMREIDDSLMSVRALAFLQDDTTLVASVGTDLAMWDVTTFARMYWVEAHEDFITSMAISPDESLIATGCDDSTVRLWDLETGALLHTFDDHTDTVHFVLFSPDGTQVASGADDTTVKIWDVESGELLHSLEGHTYEIASMAYSPDGTLLASGGGDDLVQIWDTQTGDSLLTLEDHTNSAFTVAFSPDGSQVMSGAEGGVVRVWDTSSGAMFPAMRAHTGVIVSTLFSSNGERIFTAAGLGDQTIRVWDAQQFELLDTITGFTESIDDVALSPDGTRIATSQDGKIRVYDATTGGQLGPPLLEMTGHDGTVNSIAYTPDGARMVSGGNDFTVRVWDAQTGGLLQTLEGHEYTVYGVATLPDGMFFASASGDGTIRIWDTQSGELLHTFDQQTDRVNDVAFSPDSTRVASANEDGTAEVLDVGAGDLITRLESPEGGFSCIAFSPDGSLIATGGEDSLVRLWDAQTGEEVLNPMEGHYSWVTDVVFSPDGALIISGGDYDLRIWDAQTGVQLALISEHTDDVQSLAISSDGTRIVSASADGTVRIWGIREE